LQEDKCLRLSGFKEKSALNLVQKYEKEVLTLCGILFTGWCTKCTGLKLCFLMVLFKSLQQRAKETGNKIGEIQVEICSAVLFIIITSFAPQSNIGNNLLLSTAIAIIPYTESLLDI